jgi:hypothetical protein
MQRTPRRLAFLALILCWASVGLAAPACRVREKAPRTARNFARASEQDSWREFKNIAEFPELTLDSGMSAQFWQDKKKSRSVYTVQPGQDFTILTRYCFDGGGALAQMDFEVRTPLGWGHRVEGSISGREFNARTAEFFDLKNGKAMPQPRGVGEAPSDLKPAIYLKTTDLPFASLLPVAAKPQKGKKRLAPVSSPSAE